MTSQTATKRHAIGALSVAVLLVPAGFAQADSMELTGVIHDFKTDHPDFEAYPGTSTLGIVAQQLGADGNPVLASRYTDGDKRVVYSEHSFNQWFRSVEGVNTAIPYTITLDDEDEDGVYTFAKEKPEYFFPIDDAGFGPSEGPLRWAEPGSHNFHFTYELSTLFTYSDPDDRSHALKFQFTGDDDVFVFINGKLAVDLGGVHQQERGSINLDTGTFKRYDHKGDLMVQRQIDLDLEPGGTYDLKFFFAERHTSESNFRIETTLPLKKVNPLYD